MSMLVATVGTVISPDSPAARIGGIAEISETRTASGKVDIVSRPAVEDRGQHRGLLLVGIFKLTKTLLLSLAGFGVLHFMHNDLATALQHLASRFRLDPEGHIVSTVTTKAQLLNGQKLEWIAIGMFVYAALCLIEGVGLVMRKAWAEYITIVMTAIALPGEIFEILRHVTSLRVALFVLNAAVLLYLLSLAHKKNNASNVWNLSTIRRIQMKACSVLITSLRGMVFVLIGVLELMFFFTSDVSIGAILGFRYLKILLNRPKKAKGALVENANVIETKVTMQSANAASLPFQCAIPAP